MHSISPSSILQTNMWFGYHTVSINYCFVYINAIFLVQLPEYDQLLVHYYSLYTYIYFIVHMPPQVKFVMNQQKILFLWQQRHDVIWQFKSFSSMLQTRLYTKFGQTFSDSMKIFSHMISVICICSSIYEDLNHFDMQNAA